MLESGGQPPKRRSQNRASMSAKSQGAGNLSTPDPEQKSLWQRLFRRDSRRAARRSATGQSSSRVSPVQPISTNGTAPEKPTSLRLTKPTRREGLTRSLVPLAGASRLRPKERPEPLSGSRRLPPPARLEVLPTHNLATSSNLAGPRSNSAPPPKARRRNRSTQPRSRASSVVLYLTRMLILSVGVGVLAGTALSVFDPSGRSLIGGQQQAVKQASITPGKSPDSPAAEPSTQMSKPGQEIAPLRLAVQTFNQKNPQMVPSVFVVDLDSNDYVDLAGSSSIAAASTIKLPILVAFLQDVDAGKIRLDEQLAIRKELVASGSGDMQYQPVGTRYTALDTATKMMVISDNTATNMILARLGGLRAVNERFRSWGLTTTTLNNILPDLQGTNLTSPRELAMLLARVSTGELLSMRSRDRLLDIMRRTENDSQLPQGLGTGATIAHKTGDIGSVIGDVGLVDVPNGKRYAIAVLVKRPFNDDRAYDIVSQISRLAYLQFTRPATAPAAMPAPSPNVQVSPSPAPVTPQP